MSDSVSGTRIVLKACICSEWEVVDYVASFTEWVHAQVLLYKDDDVTTFTLNVTVGNLKKKNPPPPVWESY